MTDEILTEEQAGEYLADRLNRDKPYSVHTLRSWREKGSGPRFVLVGNLIRYKKEALNQFVEDSQKEPTASERKDGE